jgi:hypothetical protein
MTHVSRLGVDANESTIAIETRPLTFCRHDHAAIVGTTHNAPHSEKARRKHWKQKGLF